MTTLADDTGRDSRPAQPAGLQGRLSDRARAERSLGWKLAGPAFIVMLAVTAYPILNAVWLSLFNYRLTDPSARSFVFLRNYVVILTDSCGGGRGDHRADHPGDGRGRVRAGHRRWRW